VRGHQQGRPRRRVLLTLLAGAIAAQLIASTAATAYLAATAHPPSPPVAGLLARTAPGLTGDISTISPAERTRRASAIRGLLERRSAALLVRDRTGFLAGVDPGSPAFRAKQAQLFDNLARVPLRSWSYVLDADHELPQSPSRLARYHAPLWVPHLDVAYELAGFDTRPTVQRQYDTFVERAGRWYLGADDDFADAGGQTGRGLWDFGPVVVTPTPTSLVLGHPHTAATLRAVASVVDIAIPRVTAVWGRDWPGKVVVLVPDTQDELSRILLEGNDLSQIAAVATAELSGSGRSPAGERIIVNPPNFAKLGTLGRDVVLTHEITHVASRAATTAATPTWLAEGFADYVGYLDTGVPVTAAAHELAVDVRAGRVPAALPTAADFAGSNPRLAQTYEMSWLACRLIAASTGRAGLVAFYRQVGAYHGAPAAAVEAALSARVHVSTAQFTRSWRDAMVRQLR